MFLELLIMVPLGLIFLYLGMLIGKKGKISLLHDYHYAKVKETDYKAYTTIMGKGISMIGLGCISSSVLNCITNSSGGWVLFGLASVYALITFIRAQKKYNGGVF